MIVYFYNMIVSEKKIIQGNWNLNIIQCVLAHLTRWDFTDGAAPFWRLYANFSPGQFLIFRKDRIELTRNNIIIIPPETPYKGILETSETDHLFIHFALNHPIIPIPPQLISLERTNLMQSCLAPLDNYVQKAHPPGDLSVNALLLVSASLNALGNRLESRPPIDARIERVRTLMENHLAEDLDMDDLARSIPLSTGGFSRLFREETGTSPLDYLNERRILRSCELLHDDTLSIEEIADRCGFSNRYYFTRVFKKYRNSTPAAFRKMIS